MKIAISSAGKDLESQVDMRFGRCPYFIIVDVEGKEIKSHEAIENTAAAQFGGAGVSAAELVANKGAKIVITGAVGPRAFDVFAQVGMEVYKANGTVKQAIDLYLEGKLEKLTMPGPIGEGMKPGRGSGMGQGAGREMGRRQM